MKSHKYEHDQLSYLKARIEKLEKDITQLKSRQKIPTNPIYDRRGMLADDSVRGQIVHALPAQMGMMSISTIISDTLHIGMAPSPYMIVDPRMAAGDLVKISFFGRPGFVGLWARCHLVRNFVINSAAYPRFESSPWAGNIGGSSGITFDWTLPTMIVGTSNIYEDTLSWTIDSNTIPEQYAFDLSGTHGGHVGYAWNNFSLVSYLGFTLDMISAGSASETYGAVTFQGRTLDAEFGAVVGENNNSGLNNMWVTLTDDVPEGYDIAVMVAYAYDPTSTPDGLFADAAPAIELYRQGSDGGGLTTITYSDGSEEIRGSASTGKTLIPHYFDNGIWRDVTTGLGR